MSECYLRIVFIAVAIETIPCCFFRVMQSIFLLQKLSELSQMSDIICFLFFFIKYIHVISVKFSYNSSLDYRNVNTIYT